MYEDVGSVWIWGHWMGMMTEGQRAAWEGVVKEGT